jgi:hypothetical protein
VKETHGIHEIFDMADPDGKAIGNGHERASSPTLAEKEPVSSRDDTGSDAVGTDIEEGGAPQPPPPAKETTKSEFT